MNNFDYLDLDGRMLHLFLTVLEEQSVTRAADRLGVTQSAVSHTLDKLRIILGDPLFVRSGRGIAATSRAEHLAEKITPLLASLKQMTEIVDFDLSEARGVFTIGANDYQRELILPPLIRELHRAAPDLDIKIIESNFSDSDSLRKARCDLLISPNPPTGLEFIQKKLFSDDWVCFFDPASSPLPDTLNNYLKRPHAKIIFTDDEKSQLDTILKEKNLDRRISLQVSRFYALPSLMRGTNLVVTLPSKIKQTIMHEFNTCRVPIAIPTMSFYMVWHLRDKSAPLHCWIRNKIIQIAQSLDTGISEKHHAR